MRILFWGTPDFAVPCLRAMDDEGFNVVGIVTQPDRPAGRGRQLRPSPIKVLGEDMGLPVLTPDVPRGDDFLVELGHLSPDLSVVVAYGHILRREVLGVPPLGSINVHASLLPELRGAAPINWAIARGMTETGVTVMRMVEAMDAGPILGQTAEPIFPDETAGELRLRLSEVGAQLLLEVLTRMAQGDVEEVEQDHSLATFAPKLDRAVARIDWDQPSENISWHVRGMDGGPGAWTELDGQPVKLFCPRIGEAGGGDEPGTILAASGDTGIVVATETGSIAFDQVQPSGKRRLDAAEWVNGRGVEVGQRFT